MSTIVWRDEFEYWHPSGGMVYTAGFLDHTLHAVDAATGAPVWDRMLGTLSDPTVADGVVYVSGS